MRALGVGLSYAIANAMFGGTAEYVALWLKSAGHESLFFWYVAGMAALGLAASIWMPDTRTRGYLEGTGNLERLSCQRIPALWLTIACQTTVVRRCAPHTAVLKTLPLDVWLVHLRPYIRQ